MNTVNPAITNMTAASRDYKILKGDALAFDYMFFEDAAKTIPINVSAMAFQLTINTTATTPTTKLAIEDEDWTRPAAHHIQKLYTVFDGIGKGSYHYRLQITHPDGRVQTILHGQFIVEICS